MFLRILLGLAVLALLVVLAMQIWQWADKRQADAISKRLVASAGPATAMFDLAMIADLPEPARRFFTFAIKPGTRLQRVARLQMRGQFGLGDKIDPKYLPMTARQILAAPYGFVWRLKGGAGVMQISGSDGALGEASWTRFWVLRLLPVARAGGNTDHARSAFGRYAAEAVFWTPAALLPQDGVRWEALGDNSARVTVSTDKHSQAVDVTVDEQGRPTQVVFQRWSNANPAKTFQLQPFGGYLSDYREFAGYMLPTKVEAGNFFGTEDYFPFFKVDVTSIDFIDPQ
jgi:hypothetical protein